jgi:hypothetical protein
MKKKKREIPVDSSKLVYIKNSKKATGYQFLQNGKSLNIIYQQATAFDKCITLHNETFISIERENVILMD